MFSCFTSSADDLTSGAGDSSIIASIISASSCRGSASKFSCARTAELAAAVDGCAGGGGGGGVVTGDGMTARGVAKGRRETLECGVCELGAGEAARVAAAATTSAGGEAADTAWRLLPESPATMGTLVVAAGFGLGGVPDVERDSGGLALGLLPGTGAVAVGEAPATTGDKDCDGGGVADLR